MNKDRLIQLTKRGDRQAANLLYQMAGRSQDWKAAQIALDLLSLPPTNGSFYTLFEGPINRDMFSEKGSRLGGYVHMGEPGEGFWTTHIMVLAPYFQNEGEVTIEGILAQGNSTLSNFNYSQKYFGGQRRVAAVERYLGRVVQGDAFSFFLQSFGTENTGGGPPEVSIVSQLRVLPPHLPVMGSESV